MSRTPSVYALTEIVQFVLEDRRAVGHVYRDGVAHAAVEAAIPNAHSEHAVIAAIKETLDAYEIAH